MKEQEHKIPHVQLNDDVDAGIITKEQANMLMKKWLEEKMEWQEVMDWFELEYPYDNLHLGS